MIIPRSGSINNFVNPELLPQLDTDEIAVFRILHIKKSADNENREEMPSHIFIKPKQYVVDPTVENGHRHLVLMGNVTDEFIDGTFTVTHPHFTGGNMGGYITVRGSVPAQNSLFTYLMLANDNESNVNRDTTYPVKFRLVKKFKQPITTPMPILSLEEQAKRGIEQNEVIINPVNVNPKLTSEIAEAMNLNIIHYDNEQRIYSFVNGNEFIAKSDNELLPGQEAVILSDKMEKEESLKEARTLMGKRIRIIKVNQKRKKI